MDLRQLRYFIAIAEAGNMTKASEKLHVAQPALSLQLANLEAYLGAKLFDRFSRGVKLTASGTMFLRHAKSILREVEEATDTFRRASGEVEGRVSIGLPTTVSTAFVSSLLTEAQRELPGVRLHLTQLSTATLRDLLTEGILDMAILMNPPEQASVNSQPLLIEHYCLVSRPDMLSAGEVIEWSEAARLPLLLPSGRSVLRVLVEENADRLGDRLKLTAELDSARLLLVGVHAGLGHAVLPRSYLLPGGEASGLMVRKIISPELRSSLQLATSALRPAGAEVAAVRELLIRLVRDFVVSGAWDAELHWSLA